MAERIVITDENKIEVSLSKLIFGVMGAGGCNAVGGSLIGGTHNQSVRMDAISKARDVVRDADPATLARVQKNLKEKEILQVPILQV